MGQRVEGRHFRHPLTPWYVIRDAHVVLHAKNPEEARPKSRPLGVLQRSDDVAPIRISSVTRLHPVWPFLAVGRSLQVRLEPARTNRGSPWRPVATEAASDGDPPCDGPPLTSRSLGSSSRSVPTAEAIGWRVRLPFAARHPVSRWSYSVKSGPVPILWLAPPDNQKVRHLGHNCNSIGWFVFATQNQFSRSVPSRNIEHLKGLFPLCHTGWVRCEHAQ